MKDGEVRVVVIDGPHAGYLRVFPDLPPGTFAEELKGQDVPPGKAPLTVIYTTRRVVVLGRALWVASAYGVPEDGGVWAAFVSEAKTGSMQAFLYAAAVHLPKAPGIGADDAFDAFVRAEREAHNGAFAAEQEECFLAGWGAAMEAQRRG